MDEIGATAIYLYEIENGTRRLVTSFLYTARGYEYMMGEDKIIHSGSVTYDGKANCSYFAYVYLTAVDSSGHDTVLRITPTV